MTDLQTLAELVARMRSAQCRYFRERSSDALRSSKDFERQVDMALANVFDGVPVLHQVQGDLFEYPKQIMSLDEPF